MLKPRRGTNTGGEAAYCCQIVNNGGKKAEVGQKSGPSKLESLATHHTKCDYPLMDGFQLLEF